MSAVLRVLNYALPVKMISKGRFVGASVVATAILLNMAIQESVVCIFLQSHVIFDGYTQRKTSFGMASWLS